MKELILDYYLFFYQKFTLKEDFTLILKKNETTNLTNFVNYLLRIYNKDSLGENFWFNYFSYQFTYWRNKKTRLGKNKVIFNWVIGKTSWERYKNRNKENSDFFINSFLTDFNIKKNQILKKPNMVFYEKDKGELKDYVENFKKFTINKDKLFLNCLSYNSLFNEKSEACRNCIWQEECKKIKKERINGRMGNLQEM